MTPADLTELEAELRDPEYAGPFQHCRPSIEIDRLFNQSADAMADLQRQLAEARAERDEARAERDELDFLYHEGGTMEVQLSKAEAERDRLAADNARLWEALKPFATMADRYGRRYLAERKTVVDASPELNLPYNYAQAVMSAAENTGWSDWDRAAEVYHAAALAGKE